MMNINRHNYEEFFLLYVDNELSATDRNAVELFVCENPDLKIELNLLEQTVAQADTFELPKKDWLYMEEDISALQETLLLYADDELNKDDNKSVDALLASDKTARAEWAILQQTKLYPDSTIIFNDKHSLYKNSGTRVVGIQWWRIAAAAAVLSFIVWTGTIIYKNNFISPVDNGGLVKTKNTESIQPTVNERSDITIPANIQTEISESQNNITKTDVKPNVTLEKGNSLQQPDDLSARKKKNEPYLVKVSDDNSSVQKTETIKLSNNLPKPHFENINNNGSNETVVQNVIPENNNIKNSGKINEVVKSNPKESLVNGAVANSINNVKAPVAADAILVVNSNTANENNNRYLKFDNEKEKRTGLGGFLRKAKRIIERTTNINTGEGVKIAGFEIALR